MKSEGTIQSSIYGDKLPELQKVCDELSAYISEVRAEIEAKTGMDPVEHYLSRIKSEESMREKCVRKGLPQNEHSALEVIKDAVGVRIVCAFIDDDLFYLAARTSLAAR